MAWTKPMISEISVGLEINSYACAEEIDSNRFLIFNIKARLISWAFFLNTLICKITTF